MTGKFPDPLVDAHWVADRLNAPDIRILDASWHMPAAQRDPKAEFAAARIPGAQFFDIDEIADTASPLPHMAPSPEKFASRMRRMGVGDGAQVVVYDTLGIFSAARVWWLFRLMGKEDVFVLDGGLPAWRAAGFTVEDGPPSPRPERHFTARPRRELIRDLAEMRRIVANGQTPILDARPAGRFAGTEPEPRPGLKGGHMPGALNLPFSAVLTVDGRMKAKEELQAVFSGLKLDGQKAAVATCGSGVSAAVVALAMARAGRWNTAIYDGSWAEWGALDDTAIVTGS
jgi:thiosulfate/3-mercaptopyruvate sulfurtransferase